MPEGYVYTARSRGGLVVYVGSTANMRIRRAEHRRTSPWWSEHATLEVVEFTTLDEARAAENDAICRWDPPYNIRGGHGSGPSDCVGPRCNRLRAETARRSLVRNYLRLRQSRRRCAPPVHEWDVARSASTTPMRRSLSDSAPETVPVGAQCTALLGRRAARGISEQLELTFDDAFDPAVEGTQEAEVMQASESAGSTYEYDTHILDGHEDAAGETGRAAGKSSDEQPGHLTASDPNVRGARNSAPPGGVPQGCARHPMRPRGARSSSTGIGSREGRGLTARVAQRLEHTTRDSAPTTNWSEDRTRSPDHPRTPPSLQAAAARWRGRTIPV